MIIHLQFNITASPSYHYFVEFIITKMEWSIILSTSRDRGVGPPDHFRDTLTIENKNNLKQTEDDGKTNAPVF